MSMEVRQLSTNLFLCQSVICIENMSLAELKLKKHRKLQFSMSKKGKKCFPTSHFHCITNFFAIGSF